MRGFATNWAGGPARARRRRCDPRRAAPEACREFPRPTERGVLPTPRPGVRNRDRARCAVQRWRGRYRRARPAHTRLRAVRLRASRYGRMCRSLFQAWLQLEHGAANPALHGAERYLHARGEILIGAAVEERTAQGGALVRRKTVEATMQFWVLLQALQCHVGSGCNVRNLSSGVDGLHVAARAGVARGE